MTKQKLKQIQTMMNESRELSGSSPLVIDQKRVKSGKRGNSNRARSCFTLQRIEVLSH